LNQVEKITGFKTSLVEDAAFVHESELVLVNFSVKIFIDFPYPLVDLRFAVREAEFSEDSDHILLVNSQSAYLLTYDFLLKASLSPLLELLALSPQILRKVFLSLSASMF